MKNGLQRFEHHLCNLQTLLSKASKQKNPALWLYQNNARTPLFMLEALAKLYANLHNKKKFTKLNEHFKLLEDTLGAIDYYDSFAKQFATNKTIPATITKYVQKQAAVKVKQMNELLAEKKWLGNTSERISKIKEKLAEADWLNDEQEIKALAAFYEEVIYKINAFVNEQKFHFDDVETDVHELRRKLRWLSIYPQALQGCIQLSKNAKAVSKTTQKYLTEEVINSPFNKLPDAGNNKYFLLLSQNHFYALSWMIAELGKLKDSGLGIIAIKEALRQTSSITDEAAYKKAYELMGSKQLKIEMLLKNAGTICKTFFKETILEYLVTGTAAVK